MKNTTALYSVNQSQCIDKMTGIEGFTLMQQAGKAVFDVMLKRWPLLLQGKTLHIFCGVGNNAGDGYIIASNAKDHGIHVKITTVKPPEMLSGDALLAWQQFEAKGGRVQQWKPDCCIEGDIIVDALLGTGINGEVSDVYKDIIHLINHSEQPVVSVDIPSGLCGDTGVIRGAAIQADLTVTIITLKKGLYTADGPQQCGEHFFVDLNTKESVYEQVKTTTCLLQATTFTAKLQCRKNNTHKGSFGHVLIIGGDLGMGGAAIMAAEAALASGAGCVKVLTNRAHIPAFLSRCPEVMVHAYETTPIKNLLKGKTSIVVGPGLGQTDWGVSVLNTLRECELPILFDADALNLIAKDKSLLSFSSKNVFTPHPGEAARLLKIKTTYVQEDRFAAVKHLQHQLEGTVVLKGSGTLIFNGYTVSVCSKGNAAMAVAGCGDILSGLIGGLLAQGYNAEDAASLGVWLHASAGDEAVIDMKGQRGLRATELIPLIRAQLNTLECTVY